MFGLKPFPYACTVLSMLAALGPPSAPWQMLETLGSVCWVTGLETTL